MLSVKMKEETKRTKSIKKASPKGKSWDSSIQQKISGAYHVQDSCLGDGCSMPGSKF